MTIYRKYLPNNFNQNGRKLNQWGFDGISVDEFMKNIILSDMKKRIIELIKFKELQLKKVFSLQDNEERKDILNDLYKNEIEISAQIKILKHLLNMDKIKGYKIKKTL